MEEHDQEDLETFTNIIRTRYYNSGYREGLFKGKSEVIQEGFDRGFRLGTLLAVFKVLEESLLSKEAEIKENESEDADSAETVEGIEKEIAKYRCELGEQVPEIKIATNLFLK